MGERRGTLLDEPLGSSGGCLDALAGDVVEHRHVALMADAHDDGQGKVGDVGCEVVVVKRVEFGCGTAAADDDHAVEQVGILVDAVQGSHDGGNRLGSLHDGIEQAGVELQSVGVALQLVDEVPVARCPCCRDDGDALWHVGPGQLLVQVDDALVGKALDDSLPLALHVAQGIAGVDVVDDDLEAIEAVIGHRDIDEHFHASCQHLTRSPEKLVVEFPVGVGPDGCTHLGDGLTVGVFLDELGVTVPAAVQPQVAGLGNDPLVAQALVSIEHLLDGGIELAQFHALRRR